MITIYFIVRAVERRWFGKKNDMNIILQTDLSREGNDCWINESVILCEQFNLYFVLLIIKVSAWSDIQEVRLLCEPTDNKSEAASVYKKHGGKL